MFQSIRPGISLVAGAAILASVLPAAAAGKVVVYTGISEPEVNRRMNEEFTRQTGIEVEILLIPSQGTVAARVQAEKDKPQADVMSAMTIDILQGMAKEGLLEQYKAPAETPEYIQKGYADPEGYWHGWYASTPAIFWNKNSFENDAGLKGTTPPATWDDLLNPAFKGKVAAPNPQTTSIGYTLLATQMFRLGEEKAWEYTRSLNDSIDQYTAAPNLVISLVEQGEVPIGLGWLAEILNSKVGKNQPLDIAVPPDNAAVVFAAAIVKNSPNPEGAKKYIDFLLSDFAQQVDAEYGYRIPLNAGVAPPQGSPAIADIKTVKFDIDWAAQNRDRLRKQWGDETGQ